MVRGRWKELRMDCMSDDYNGVTCCMADFDDWYTCGW